MLQKLKGSRRCLQLPFLWKPPPLTPPQVFADWYLLVRCHTDASCILCFMEVDLQSTGADVSCHLQKQNSRENWTPETWWITAWLQSLAILTGSWWLSKPPNTQRMCEELLREHTYPGTCLRYLRQRWLSQASRQRHCHPRLPGWHPQSHKWNVCWWDVDLTPALPEFVCPWDIY